jgi:hypothetical protein
MGTTFFSRNQVINKPYSSLPIICVTCNGKQSGRDNFSRWCDWKVKRLMIPDVLSWVVNWNDGNSIHNGFFNIETARDVATQAKRDASPRYIPEQMRCPYPKHMLHGSRWASLPQVAMWHSGSNLKGSGYVLGYVTYPLVIEEVISRENVSWLSLNIP